MSRLRPHQLLAHSALRVPTPDRASQRYTRWDATPSLALNLIEGVEVAGGYRFGDLRDPDFSVGGDHGWFVTFGVRLTERVFPTAADFWRARF